MIFQPFVLGLQMSDLGRESRDSGLQGLELGFFSLTESALAVLNPLISRIQPDHRRER